MLIRTKFNHWYSNIFASNNFSNTFSAPFYILRLKVVKNVLVVDDVKSIFGSRPTHNPPNGNHRNTPLVTSIQVPVSLLLSFSQCRPIEHYIWNYFTNHKPPFEQPLPPLLTYLSMLTTLSNHLANTNQRILLMLTNIPIWPILINLNCIHEPRLWPIWTSNSNLQMQSILFKIS